MIKTSGMAAASARPTDAGHGHGLALVDDDALGVGAAADDAHHLVADRPRTRARSPSGRHPAGELHARDLVAMGGPG